MSKRANVRAAARARSRQLAAQRRRRQTTRWTSVVAATALLIAGVIGVLAWQADQPDDSAAPTVTTADGLGLPVGDGPVLVEVYLDFLCPACKQFHDAARPVLDSYLEQGTITLVYRPIAILDRLTSTEFSTRAAAAAGCAAGRGAIDEFVAAMLASQPPEGSAGLSDAEIVQVAAGAGVTQPGFGECVRAGTYRDWVARATDAAADRGVTGTPTVFVNGERWQLSTVEDLVAVIEAGQG
ncbi:MAG TPA: thioredoxin domain-containing protein [Natronosporangium sp.]